MKRTARSDSRGFGREIKGAEAEMLKRLDNRMELIKRAGGIVNEEVRTKELFNIADDYWRAKAARYGYEYRHMERRRS